MCVNLICSTPPDTDTLVEWKDGSKNVVMAGDLVYRGNLKTGSKVTMNWEDQRWHGVVLDIELPSSDGDESSDSDTGIPLAQLKNKYKNTGVFFFKLFGYSTGQTNKGLELKRLHPLCAIPELL